MFAVGDRVEVAESVKTELHQLSGMAAAVITVGAKGTVVDVSKRAGGLPPLIVVDFDCPETPAAGLTRSDYRNWWLTPKDLIPAGQSFQRSSKRDDLANRYTNEVCYDELGFGLKELIDRLIDAEDKLETIHNITKKETN